MAVTALNPDRPCPHADFNAEVTIGRIGEEDADANGYPRAFICEIKVSCAVCDEPFRFVGALAGLSFKEPMVTVDEATLLAPIRPASSDPDFGMGLPGYAVKAVFP